ncbi:unnamed protein product, partial [Mesorhabditis spiculigera]
MYDLHTHRNITFLDNLYIPCEALIRGDQTAIDLYGQQVYDNGFKERMLLEEKDLCAAFKNRFHFQASPLSEEEAEFPLAYGFVVYKNVVQVLHMLAAFYQPQNLYCINIDSKSPDGLKKLLRGVESCFPNVHVVIGPSIEWGSYEIVTAVWNCLSYAEKSAHAWKYYQYLTGTDAPLKTNLEMVRIFKALNGTMNMSYDIFNKTWLQGKQEDGSPFLPIYKSFIPALIPRPAATAIVGSSQVADYLKWLKGCWIPEELIWATIAGRPDLLPWPGAVPNSLMYQLKGTTEQMLAQLIKGRNKTQRITITEDFYGPATFDTPNQNWIARYQGWNSDDLLKCNKFTHTSCVFRVAELAALRNRPELTAHKINFEDQPVAFFCLLKEHLRRSLNPEPFDARNYTRLPEVELLRGVPLDELSMPKASVNRLRRETRG